MRILIDTNILISAALFPNSVPYRTFMKAVTLHHAMICSQNAEEMQHVFMRKFPERIGTLNRFLDTAIQVLEVVTTPDSVVSSEILIRDKADRPILRAALAYNADIILTGDKDFLESGIIHPKCISPSDFLGQ